ncbi:hypothetical protein RISK_001771 [Rhodopirellula islandica]|uniref:Uncharacterized protein n=1 Tax=Rhodopirellula islandica TaxID=595434 RepID=A0A0J1BHB4_RHOIS|nr:hypothetical protein RISK_001771 [Rhodopirellula islandica]
MGKDHKWLAEEATFNNQNRPCSIGGRLSDPRIARSDEISAD